MSNTNNSFVSNINNSFYANPSSSVLDDLFREYQRVIFRSIVTSFGLDLLIHDQYGGDVDTVHNVRSIGIDPQMKYKNSQNATAYDTRGDYSHKDVEGTGTNFQRTKHEARAKYMEDPRNNTVQDAYEDKPLGFLGKSKGHPTEKSAELQLNCERGKIGVFGRISRVFRLFCIRRYYPNTIHLFGFGDAFLPAMTSDQLGRNAPFFGNLIYR